MSSRLFLDIFNIFYKSALSSFFSQLCSRKSIIYQCICQVVKLQGSKVEKWVGEASGDRVCMAKWWRGCRLESILLHLVYYMDGVWIDMG